MIDLDKVHLNVRKIRELKNLSQSYVADMLGISTRTYSKIETGETQLTLSRLKEICEVLGTSPEEVFEFDVKMIFQNNPMNQQGGEFKAYNNTDVEHIERLYERLLQEKDRVIELLRQKCS